MKAGFRPDFGSEKFKKARIATQENHIKYWYNRIKKSPENMAMLQEYFDTLSDEAFWDLLQRMSKGEIILPLIDPNFSANPVTIANNLAIAKEIGLSFFKQLIFDKAGNRPKFLTPIAYPVYLLPLRRQAQLAIKKISVAENNARRDDLTGQATGASKGSSLSYMENYVMQGLGCVKSLEEMLKYRGGDSGGFHAMNVFASRYGSVSLKTIERYATGVEATKAVRAWLTSMHFDVSMPNQPAKILPI